MGKTERLVADDTNDSRNRQHTSETAKEVTETIISTMQQWCTFSGRAGLEEETRHSSHFLGDDAELDYCRGLGFRCISIVVEPHEQELNAIQVLKCS